MPDNKLITKLELIERYARNRENENWKFRTFVKHRLKMPDEELDALVRETTDDVWMQIDCTQCANCCRTMQVIVDDADIVRLAGRLGMTKQTFTRRYVKFDANKEGYFATAPCPFLKDNVCSVYEDRPKACRDFPYLHEKEFRTRMMAAIENTALCPIVFNTYEELKRRLPFRKPKSQKGCE